MHAVSSPSAAGVVGVTWTETFGAFLVEMAETRTDIVAVSAAMRLPVGLGPFSERFPERFMDVGIAEQHAFAAAAGLASGGYHPVVAVYSTFMNRAFDQMVMDIGLHGARALFVADRAGITGDDGASHNGVWDLSLFQVVPGLRVGAPRDAPTLLALMDEALATDGPTLLRFPKGLVPEPLIASKRFGALEVLAGEVEGDVLVVAVGALAHACVDAAELLRAEGLAVTVVDPRWVVPVQEDLPALARHFSAVVTVEDGIVVGGIGAEVRRALDDQGLDCAFRSIGVPRGYLPHGSRSDLLRHLGLDARNLARRIRDLALTRTYEKVRAV